MAGINMASAFDGKQSVAGYARSRVRRLFPELGVVWCVAVLFVILGAGTAGLWWFIGTAPFFLHNLSLPFFNYSLPQDWVFAPLWFVGTLLQLQVLLFASKRFWFAAKPASIIIAAVCIGLSYRLLFGWLLAAHPRNLLSSSADALYCLPFCHAEAITLGLMLGRGALPGIGRWLPVFVVVALGLGALNVWLSPGLVSVRSLGFEFPLRTNYIYVWGYLVLAFVAASVCAKNGPLAVAFERMKRPPWLDHGLARLGALTYGVYVFHGIIMATGLNGSGWLSREHAPYLRLLLFAITIIESLLLAWIFAWFMRVAIPALLKTRLKGAQLEGAIRAAKWRANKQTTPPDPGSCVTTIHSAPRPRIAGDL